MLGFFDPTISYNNQGIIQGAATGRVTNDKGEPIPGATISINGTRTSVLTDVNGFFKIQNFGMNSSMLVSAIGYNSKQVLLTPGYFTITLKESTQALAEVVVTGYGSERRTGGVDALESPLAMRREMTGSIQTVTVATQYQPTTLLYKIDNKYSLETDGKTTTIGINQFDIPATYDYFSAPKIDPSAFLTAKIINWQDYNLQSGEASLYYEGTYLGKTYIDLSAVSDTLSLSLGKDNDVKVSRKLVKEYSAKRFIGSNRTDSRQYEISVRNTKQVAVNVIITDQFPVSTTKEIEVEDENAADAQVDKDTGIITWSLTIPPAQEKKLTLRYSVRYPKDRKVVLE